MQEENFEGLKTSLEIRGFDASIFPQLEKNMKEGKTDFVLQYEHPLDENRTVLCQLSFDKHQEQDHYFFNRYQATLVNAGEVMAQISVRTSWKIKVQEAARMMEYGQNVAVYKQNIIGYRQVEEDHPAEQFRFNAYISLDPEGKTDDKGNLLLNTYHDNYCAKRPFDIIDQLENPEVQFETKKAYESVEVLAKDLQHANRIAIVLDRNGVMEDGFLGLNARRGKINFMDANGISIDITPAKAEKLEAKENAEVKKKPWVNQGPQKVAWKPKQNKGLSR
ncbi:hypothetical protein HMPREF3127_04680 [Sphingobacterium sp. HMSC13C05]|uniref:hypothetical protein n=1 Tax=Sphingobacterium sp. HMSC13C05 TaxID=1581095 RepID=UPI0008A39C8E|nr:hypothetical protein [Sphingobacterium sp. HMSC13C05]OFV19518.1 hypothetical protein HMPREF3127_04680 [Sphingobacterium sp. HMSC13C05]